MKGLTFKTSHSDDFGQTQECMWAHKITGIDLMCGLRRWLGHEDLSLLPSTHVNAGPGVPHGAAETGESLGLTGQLV